MAKLCPLIDNAHFNEKFSEVNPMTEHIDLDQGSQTQIALRAKQKVLINLRAAIHKRSRIKKHIKTQ